MSTVVTNIGELHTQDPARGADSVLHDAAVIIEGERISWLGPAAQAPDADEQFAAEERGRDLCGSAT